MTMTIDDFDDEPTSMSAMMRAEAARIRKHTDIGHAAINTPGRQRINELQTAYRAAVEQVRNDPNLSERGKQQTLSRYYTNVRRAVDKLNRADRDTQIKRYDEIERQVFGTASTLSGADAVAFRDAVDRATKLENPEAATLALGTAQMSGDSVLAQAVAMRAWRDGWTDVVESYAVHNPKVTDQLAELGALQHTLGSSVSALGGGITTSVHKPEELQGLGPQDIARYAETDPQPSRQGLDNMNTALGVALTNGNNQGMPSQREFNDYAQSVRANLQDSGE